MNWTGAITGFFSGVLALICLLTVIFLDHGFRHQNWWLRFWRWELSLPIFFSSLLIFFFTAAGAFS